MAASVEDERQLEARFEFASGLIRDAAALALEHYRDLDSPTITDKGRQDMATEVDSEVERLIRGRLAERFPGDAFLGEETGRTDVLGSDSIWVVDPIDGTQPFIYGMTPWCVSIALVSRGELEMGFVSAPARDELFVGRRGGRGTLNDRPISVRAATRLDGGVPLHGVLTSHRCRRRRPHLRSRPAPGSGVLPRGIRGPRPLLRGRRAAHRLHRAAPQLVGCPGRAGSGPGRRRPDERLSGQRRAIGRCADHRPARRRSTRRCWRRSRVRPGPHRRHPEARSGPTCPTHRSGGRRDFA